MTYDALGTHTPVPFAPRAPAPIRHRTGGVLPPTPLSPIRRACLFVLDVVRDTNRLRRTLRRQHSVPDA